ncbi:Phospholipase/carboxylesterase/thioesterase [Penicillium cataractarum]|uniref:Acyl-protein thioesterase 1 n=1 Tax=Penicillium cataractarum TaxID=2100454 RepID=A0A9W9RE93_9EURO|nr:Phospholipase/carboxylesterase/thioesterase [Penicillium cataractarum]KAJ5358640.1 Phospholipase/carboxylesterase/thioesterase [Penicillium cataractarum]
MVQKPYPTPLVIQPLHEEHTYTIISLHGRGSNAERYGCELLQYGNLQARLLTVKFIFPTARKRRATIFKRMPINQWFDNYSLDGPGQKVDLQVEGHCETAGFIRGLIDEEGLILGEGGHQKIIVGHFTLLGGWNDSDAEKFIGAFVGMSGWLPFEQQLRDILRCDDSPVASQNEQHETQSDDSDTDEDESSEQETDSDEDVDESTATVSDSESDDDPFQRTSSVHDDVNVFEGDEEEAPVLVQAINHIRDILDLSSISTNKESSENELSLTCLYHLQTPVFLGHFRHPW